MPSANIPDWLLAAVADFGETCKAKLAGPGDREAAIRAPIEALLTAAGGRFGLRVVPHDEVRDTERRIRPDYAFSVNGAITGYVEVKRPGHSVDPATFRGHDLVQWERQRDLPNLIYTNGTEWRRWHDGEPAWTGPSRSSTIAPRARSSSNSDCPLPVKDASREMLASLQAASTSFKHSWIASALSSTCVRVAITSSIDDMAAFQPSRNTVSDHTSTCCPTAGAGHTGRRRLVQLDRID